ncbi:MAG: hypothetical protein IJ324_05990, partial [Lachnospiraceae bacterium]|nr:hypothetical protein [Lachnospiraceae bacterium]
EYKQWVMNEMSQMPVSEWYRSTCVGGSLIITEEAFEKMKSDPEWENTVMNMVRKMYSTNGIMGSKMIGFQVIGASPEECYGEGIPVKSGGNSDNLSDDEESWWEKRHEKMEELLEEQAKAAQKKSQLNRALAQEEYLNSQFENAQRFRAFLESRMQGVMNMSGTFGNAGVLAAATTAYEQTISQTSSMTGVDKL